MEEDEEIELAFRSSDLGDVEPPAVEFITENGVRIGARLRR
jgi:hypothetical protein